MCLKDGLEQKLPVVITWAKDCGAQVCLSAFACNDAGSSEKTRLYHLLEKMTTTLSAAGIGVETETAHGFHFGTSMVQRTKQTGSDLIAIAVEPANFVSLLFTKMVAPYFLENSPVPVLAVPLMKSSGVAINAPSNTVSTLPAAGLTAAAV